MPLLTEWQVSFLVTPESIRLIPHPSAMRQALAPDKGEGSILLALCVWRLAFGV
jgi:hypothetical protein